MDPLGGFSVDVSSASGGVTGGAGSDDEGDVVVIVAGETYLFECKNTAKLELDNFWNQIEIEATNYAKARNTKTPFHYVLWKRKRKGINQTWVIQSLDQWLEEKK